MEFKHKSILLGRSVDFLITDTEGVYVDCTMGGGGHSAGFAARLGAGGLVVGIDQDADAVEAGTKRLAEGGFACKIRTARANFKDFTAVLDGFGVGLVDGIFFDLGVSSYQLDNAARGFSYMHDGPLDMRMDRSCALDAAYVVNRYGEEELDAVIRRYGEERWSARIAKFIVAERRKRPIVTTGQLVEVIKKAVPKGARQDGPHPAKRTFQALRIEVNNELGILEKTLEAAVGRLKSGGRIGVITFHSLEDRIVKQVFARLVRGCICPPRLPVCVCGKKPMLTQAGSVVPSAAEVEENPRSRSARLRCAVRI